jgi:hypothetical protein
MFGDKRVIDGAKICGLKLTDTLSKVAIPCDGELLPPFTTKPTYTFAVMLTVWLLARVQLAPSDDA